MTATPETILKDVFGYDDFRPLQREVIRNVLNKHDTLVIMPTGGGKSLCYQIPALIFPGLTVVVTPLISLMKDQVEQLHEFGVPALFLNSSLSFEAYQDNLQQVRSGQIKLLYVAPETLLTPRLLDLIGGVPFSCLTIDEAHCISEWGHDFRPEYRQLVEVRQRFPQAVCLALTATATPRVREDIRSSLSFASSDEFIASFNRPNLKIEVAPKTNPLDQTLAYLQKYKDQSGIVYCFSRKQVDNLTAQLARRGYSVRPYHAGLADDERRQNQERFIRDDVQIMVATIAFGMGINKPDVRFVVHYDLPKSIESYYQEIGRAGRDGLQADCLLLYSYGDVHKLRYFIDQRQESEQEISTLQLQALTRYAESLVCRRVPLLAYFGERYATDNCGMCDICLNGAQEQVDITVPAQKFLSCVVRTGEMFGAAHIADVLLGSKNQKVLKFGHQDLSTYGIGQDLTRKQWFHIGRQLVQKGLLAEDPHFHSLKLSEKGANALRTREPVLGVIQAEQPAKTPAQKAGQIEHDTQLFEILRAKRKELADAAGIPPYVIFPDRTLYEIAAYYPQSGQSLQKIHGVGQVKAERYGEIFLTIIQLYCQEHDLEERTRPSAQPLPAGQMNMDLKPRQLEVAEAYNDGTSVEGLAEIYQVKLGTILDHLWQFERNGGSLRPSDDFLRLAAVDPAQQAQALAAFQELGTDYLKPVFENLDGALNYDQLRLLRLHYLSSQEKT
jgi:ATP-dependent DNA helicase RecQ